MSYPAYPVQSTESAGKVSAIPNGWRVRRLKFAATCNDDALPETTDPEFEMDYVDISSVNLIDGITNSESLTFDKAPSRARRVVKDGDTIVSTVRTYLKAIAAIELPPANMIVSTGFAVIRPLEFVDSKFLGYALQNVAFIDAVVANSTGVSYPAINPTSLICLPIAYPKDKDAQRHIAAFLDWKTGQIDALIAKKKELMERLKEKRLAVITRAVTMGLNPAAPLHDSCIPWLGDVPVHWEVLPIKYLLTAILDTEHKTCPYYDDGEFLVARTPNIRDGKLILDGGKYTDADGYQEWTVRGIPKPGDILFTREAPAGEACIVPDEPQLCIGQRVVLFRTDSQILESRYAIYSIYGGAARNFIEMHSLGSTVTHFNMSEIAMIPMLAPPIDEQTFIAEYLDEQTSKIDQMMRKVESAISALTEYRIALITATTTGKIDVRQVAIPVLT